MYKKSRIIRDFFFAKPLNINKIYGFSVTPINNTEIPL